MLTYISESDDTQINEAFQKKYTEEEIHLISGRGSAYIWLMKCQIWENPMLFFTFNQILNNQVLEERLNLLKFRFAQEFEGNEEMEEIKEMRETKE